MPRQSSYPRSRAVLTAVAAAVVAVAGAGLLAVAGSGPASASQAGARVRVQPRGGGGGIIGSASPADSAQINLLAHPGLCWQSHGNGSPVTLQACNPALQEQQWTLTGNGVLMNGAGYCLEGTGVPAGGGDALYVDFAGQCGGSAAGQVWRFSGTTGQLSAPRAGVCAYPAGGRAAAGVQVVRHACGGAVAHARWSWGYSAVTLAAGHGRGTAAGRFATSVTVSNAASAMTAYGVSVRVRPAAGLTVTGLKGAGGASALTCDARTLTCSGTLAPGSSGRIGMTGRIAASAAAGHDYAITAQVTVAGTSQSPAARQTSADASVTALPPSATAGSAPANGAGATRAGGGPHAEILLIAVLAVVLLAGGGLLVVLVRRRPRGRGMPQGGGTGENGARERRGGSHSARRRRASV